MNDIFTMMGHLIQSYEEHHVCTLKTSCRWHGIDCTALTFHLFVYTSIHPSPADVNDSLKHKMMPSTITLNMQDQIKFNYILPVILKAAHPISHLHKKTTDKKRCCWFRGMRNCIFVKYQQVIRSHNKLCVRSQRDVKIELKATLKTDGVCDQVLQKYTILGLMPTRRNKDESEIHTSYKNTHIGSHFELCSCTKSKRSQSLSVVQCVGCCRLKMLFLSISFGKWY